MVLLVTNSIQALVKNLGLRLYFRLFHVRTEEMLLETQQLLLKSPFKK